MLFQSHPQDFQSMAQWHAWRLGLDLAQPRREPTADEVVCQRFFGRFLTDLFTHPQAYRMPEDEFEPSKPDDAGREARLRVARLKARRAVEGGLLDFFYQIGQNGEVDDQTLRVAQPFYDQLLAEKRKQLKNKAFPQELARIGITCERGEAWGLVAAEAPGLLPALAAFARQCASIPEYGFYFFRRADFGVFDQKRLPQFDDGLNLLSETLRDEVRRTDAFLNAHKFKRELFVAEGDGGYRMRYQKKAGKLTYWCRLRSWSSIELDHNLRWDFASAVTARLFERLDAAHPGLADRVFDGIKKCTHDYENCIARVVIANRGGAQEICQEAGWATIGVSPADFDLLRQVIEMLDELTGRKK